MQVAQAGELIHSLRNLTIPVVLCCDFNYDANFGNGPDATPSVALIETAGYADTWRIANPSDPGDTILVASSSLQNAGRNIHGRRTKKKLP